MSYGGTIVSLRTPDRSGTLGDIVLGCDTLAGYFTQPAYLGALIGRCANRITGGSFPLDGRTYTLARNQGQDHLHGGLRGFDKVVWDAEPFAAGVTLRHSSPAGDEGYPGRLDVKVRYSLSDDDELEVAYQAETTAATPVNLTQHSYFNLAGHGDVLGHELQLDADYFTPVGANLIPTGVVAPVAGTPFDFRTPRRIGDRIGAEDRQLHYAGGYDHNYVIRRTDPGLAHAARVRDPESGRTLDVLTTEPGVQLYTGNFLDGSIVGKHGQRYGRRAGFCLETQHYPDSPNRPEFPSIILRPDRQYRSRTVFKFGVAT
jgi:aldose 1-epimerase